MTKSPILAKDLNEKLLLENFGPGTFASAEEIAADEENDAKLWFDLIQSMEIWQNNKFIRDKRKRYIIGKSAIFKGPIIYFIESRSPSSHKRRFCI